MCDPILTPLNYKILAAKGLGFLFWAPANLVNH